MNRRILVVCFGNTERSPIAEAILNQLLKDYGFEVVSAGINAYGDEDSPSEMAALFLSFRGIPFRTKKSNAFDLRTREGFGVDIDYGRTTEGLHKEALRGNECLYDNRVCWGRRRGR